MIPQWAAPRASAPGPFVVAEKARMSSWVFWVLWVFALLLPPTAPRLAAPSCASARIFSPGAVRARFLPRMEGPVGTQGIDSLAHRQQGCPRSHLTLALRQASHEVAVLPQSGAPLRRSWASSSAIRLFASAKVSAILLSGEGASVHQSETCEG